jgi:hypothetical protein
MENTPGESRQIPRELLPADTGFSGAEALIIRGIFFVPRVGARFSRIEAGIILVFA